MEREPWEGVAYRLPVPKSGHKQVRSYKELFRGRKCGSPLARPRMTRIELPVVSSACVLLALGGWSESFEPSQNSRPPPRFPG